MYQLRQFSDMSLNIEQEAQESHQNRFIITFNRKALPFARATQPLASPIRKGL